MRLTKALFDECEVIHINALNIESCDDCKYCNHVAGCKFKHDEMPKLIDKIKQANTLVIASPIYFGALTDQLLKVINRFQQFFSAKFTLDAPYPEVQSLFFVNTCGADNNTMFDGAKLTMNILASLLNAEHKFQFTMQNTDHLSKNDEKKIIKDYKIQLKNVYEQS